MLQRVQKLMGTANLFGKANSRKSRRGFVEVSGLESLEGRVLLAASSVYSSKGDLNTFIVHQDGTLKQTNSSGTTTIDHRPGVLVRNVHAYLDAQKQVAHAVVYVDGKAYTYDSNGETFVDEKVLDIAVAFGKKGEFQIDVLYSTAGVYSDGVDQNGTLKRTTKTGTVTVGIDIRWISNFVDPNGKIGSVIAVKDAGNLVVTRADSTGTVLLYKASNGATQDMTEYSQASRGKKNIVITVTSGRFAGSYSLQMTKAGTVMLGNGTDIKVGG